MSKNLMFSMFCLILLALASTGAVVHADASWGANPPPDALIEIEQNNDGCYNSIPGQRNFLVWQQDWHTVQVDGSQYCGDARAVWAQIGGGNFIEMWPYEPELILGQKVAGENKTIPWGTILNETNDGREAYHACTDGSWRSENLPDEGPVYVTGQHVVPIEVECTIALYNADSILYWSEQVVTTIPVQHLNAVPSCETPGQQSNNLLVNGFYTEDTVPVEGVTVTAKVGTVEVSTTTAANGTYSLLIEDARNMIGETVTVSAEGVDLTFVITQQIFDACTVYIPVKELTVMPVCETPGQPSNNLVVAGTYTEDGVGVEGVDVVASINGVQKTNTTDANGNYSILLENARSQIGSTVVVVASTEREQFEITSELFNLCTQTEVVRKVTSFPSCETPGQQSNNLIVSGTYTEDGVGIEGIMVMLKVGNNTIPTLTDQNGNYSIVLSGARGMIGEMVKISAMTAKDSFTITSKMFDACTVTEIIKKLTTGFTCDTPGMPSDNLVVEGFYTENSVGIEGVTVSAKVGAIEVSASTDTTGYYRMVLPGARSEIGNTLTVAANGEEVSSVVTSGMFDACAVEVETSYDVSFGCGEDNCGQVVITNNGPDPIRYQLPFGDWETIEAGTSKIVWTNGEVIYDVVNFPLLVDDGQEVKTITIVIGPCDQDDGQLVPVSVKVNLDNFPYGVPDMPEGSYLQVEVFGGANSSLAKGKVASFVINGPEQDPNNAGNFSCKTGDFMVEEGESFWVKVVLYYPDGTIAKDNLRMANPIDPKQPYYTWLSGHGSGIDCVAIELALDPDEDLMKPNPVFEDLLVEAAQLTGQLIEEVVVPDEYAYIGENGSIWVHDTSGEWNTKRVGTEPTYDPNTQLITFKMGTNWVQTDRVGGFLRNIAPSAPKS